MTEKESSKSEQGSEGQEKKSKKEDKDGIPLAALAYVPGLVLKLGFSTIKFKRRVIKHSRKLRKGLIKGGLPPEMADRLVTKYEADFSIRKIIGNATGDSDFPSVPLFDR